MVPEHIVGSLDVGLVGLGELIHGLEAVHHVDDLLHLVGQGIGVRNVVEGDVVEIDTGIVPLSAPIWMKKRRSLMAEASNSDGVKSISTWR